MSSCSNSRGCELTYKKYYRIMHVYCDEIIGFSSRLYNSLEEAHKWMVECQANNHDNGFGGCIEEILLAQCNCT